jgi:membrane protease YdiL (CAAX protease family)
MFTVQILIIVLLLLYLVSAVISDVTLTRKYRGGLVSGDMRFSFYRQSIFGAWIATAIIGATALLGGIAPENLGLCPVSLERFSVPIAFAIVVSALSAILLIVMLAQTVSFIRNPEARDLAWKKLTEPSEENQPANMTLALLPRSRKQRRVFVFVALTAGICEEFLMRGALFAVLPGLFPGINLYLYPVIAGLLFGVAHAYQGPSGIVKTGAVGTLLGFLYLASGSLAPVIVLHAVIDLSSGFIAPEERE